MSYLVEGENCHDIWNDFAGFYRKLTSESQLRWVGPEKGVVHLATGECHLYNLYLLSCMNESLINQSLGDRCYNKCTVGCVGSIRE